MNKTLKSIYALGIMNGTSVDGIDYSLIKVAPPKAGSKMESKLIFHKQKKIPPLLVQQILMAAKNELSTFDLSRLHSDLGRLYRKHIKSLPHDKPFHVIGIHGQTVHHQGGLTTFQLGSPAFIKEAFPKTPVVSDFRSMDIAVGGQGAPFAPFFQKFLLPKTPGPHAFQNLGGIANLSYFEKGQSLALDSGPANILIDAWVRHKSRGKKQYDDQGKGAARGLYELKALDNLMAFKYFSKKPPKSCGREEFNLEFIIKNAGSSWKKLSLEDQLATLTELSAVTIARAYKKFVPKIPKKIYAYGGGVNNDYLMKRIQYHLPESQWTLTDDLGWPSQALEGALIAFLAAARMWEQVVHIPKVTGAKRPVLLGQVL